MFNPLGMVFITLGSVVLDRPDQTGQYFAKDLAGGWAYLIGDAEGDNRYRGHGVCDGGLDLTLRCAFLSAVNRVPECRHIKVLVETREAHRRMVQLAVKDAHVAAVIGGRAMSVMTRPDTRSAMLVKAAAERAASIALRDREHAEWESPAAADAEAGGGDAELTASEAKSGTTGSTGEGTTGSAAGQGWRSRLGVRQARQAATAKSRGAMAASEAKPVAEPAAGTPMQRLLNPLLKTARDGLASAGVLSPRPVPRARGVQAWLRELDGHVASVRGDLQDVGA